ncbi:uncharacterized protein LOC105735351 [Apis florea]|uniref:uncharacterized protein LOC105735351 n=1 Tax=Apis florea TaxID=7463 RepID=UPI000629678C|nr:uncharacterized protein LOC105735351 [Apis florea]
MVSGYHDRDVRLLGKELQVNPAPEDDTANRVRATWTKLDSTAQRIIATSTRHMSLLSQDIGSRNAETEKRQYQTKDILEEKERQLIGTMSVDYNLEASSDAWHLDSGATEHMSNRREWFSSYRKFDTVENIKIGDGKYIQVIGSGDIDIFAFNGKKWEKLPFRKAIQNLNVSENSSISDLSVQCKKIHLEVLDIS